jgi:hypothetical protein
MRFFDNLGKSLQSGVDRAKFEADKFQRTSRISGEISNFKSQIETNMRQLGERALELYQQGTLQAPEIASLAQIISQLREQQEAKERELERANTETFEQYQAAQASQVEESAPPQASGQNVPISREAAEGSFPTPTGSGSQAIPVSSTDISGSGLPNASSVGGSETQGERSYTCASCGQAIPAGATFCPNCGARVPSP